MPGGGCQWALGAPACPLRGDRDPEPQACRGTPVTIHLDQYGGYFAAQETLADLTPGKYRFVVYNKAGKLVGFQIQVAGTHEPLDMSPWSPGASRTSEVTISANGFRYRCPINPTPWYEVDTLKSN